MGRIAAYRLVTGYLTIPYTKCLCEITSRKHLCLYDKSISTDNKCKYRFFSVEEKKPVTPLNVTLNDSKGYIYTLSILSG